MLFRRDKKKKTPEKTPVWFMWLMGGFVGYALIANIFSDKVSEVKDENAPRKQSDMEYFNFGAVGTQVRGSVPVPLFLRDVKVGQGMQADCWFVTRVHYKLYDTEGNVVEDTRAAEPVEFNLGAGQVPLAFERTVLGMREGGERAATAHPALLYGDERFDHPKFTSKQYGGIMLELLDAERPVKLPVSDLGLRVYEDAEGEGRAAQCTDRLRVRMRGWNTKGQPLWRDLDLPAMWVRLGEGVAPYAVERGLFNMKVGGRRTLIVPAGYMNPLLAQTTEEKVAEILAQESQPAEEVVAEDAAQQAEEAKAYPEEGAAARAYQKRKEAMIDEFPWDSLPVPADEVIILELELLPEQITLPGQPKQSQTQ